MWKKIPFEMEKVAKCGVYCKKKKTECWDNKPETKEKQLFGGEQLFNGAFIERANAHCNTCSSGLLTRNTRMHNNRSVTKQKPKQKKTSQNGANTKTHDYLYIYSVNRQVFRGCFVYLCTRVAYFYFHL